MHDANADLQIVSTDAGIVIAAIPAEQNADSSMILSRDFDSKATNNGASHAAKLNLQIFSTEAEMTIDSQCVKHRITDVPDTSINNESRTRKRLAPGAIATQLRCTPRNAELSKNSSEHGSLTALS
jgi:hypothetical protein